VETSDDNAGLQPKLQQIHELFTDTWKKVILERAGSDSPREIIAGYEAALTMLNKITTTNAASSALHTFGRYSEGSGRVTKCHRLGNIPVQTTAVARRRKCLRGRAPGEAGRPKKLSILKSNMHSYSMPSRKKGAPAPHKLSECVRRNINIGGTHSKK